MNDPLDQLQFSDFGPHFMKQSYLNSYGVEIVGDKPHEYSNNAFTMIWKYGFMQCTSLSFGRKIAEEWAFYFVWHWLRGGDCADLDTKACKFVEASIRKHPYYRKYCL